MAKWVWPVGNCAGTREREALVWAPTGLPSGKTGDK